MELHALSGALDMHYAKLTSLQLPWSGFGHRSFEGGGRHGKNVQLGDFPLGVGGGGWV